MLTQHPTAVGIAAIGVIGLLMVATIGAHHRRITPEALASAIAGGDAPRIMDVRTTNEYAAGHIPGAIHIPYHTVWQRRGEIPGGVDAPIVVTCAHGPRAGMAAVQLRLLGYRNIVYLRGQMAGWKRRGLPMDGGGRETVAPDGSRSQDR